MKGDRPRLTAPELGSLWTQYMYDTMAICFADYVLTHVEDEEIKSLYKTALKLSKRHIKQIKQFYEEENAAVPHGFTSNDVIKDAPRLFQDQLYLNYLYIMNLHGLTGYSLSVGTSVREDLRKYFIQCNTETMTFYDETMNVMLRKGLYTRPPTIEPPKQAGFVQHQSFLSGWFGERRPLTALEISDITFNMNKMNLHVSLKVGFSQVAKSKQVRELLKRGIDITNKQTEIFSSIFNEEKLNSPVSWQSQVTNSTTQTFSDKYIMYQTLLSTQAAIAFYGSAMSVNSRKDLGAHYTRLISELVKYTEDCANLMIKNGWLEEPPKASDRDALAQHNRE